MLEITNLTKTYPNGETALNDVSFTVPHGQVVIIVGPSGAGKSTLIKCINRLVEPTAGSVVFNEMNLTILHGRSLRHFRRQIGFIFQNHALVDRLTVMENVLAGRLGYVRFWQSLLARFPGDDVQKAYALLERVGLSDHINKRADELSGGQRQRVGIARALMQTDELLLVDEPTASLDPKTARQVMRLIVELVREHNLSALINIHDVPLARQFADRVIGLRDGRLVFDGRSEQLDDQALTAIYGEEDWHEAKRNEVHDQNRHGLEISESELKHA